MARIILAAYAEEQRLQYLLNQERKLLRARAEPLSWPQKTFYDWFRLRKNEYVALCHDLVPLLPTPLRNDALAPEIKILATLHFLANGSYQRSIGGQHILGIAQPTVSLCVEEVVQALNNPQILDKYIKFPFTPAERQIVTRRFFENFGFPGVVGCLDGTHVSVIRPTHFEESYFNRKQYHSLNVLVICDADLKISHVDASFGGASHDSHVWNCSPVHGYLESLHAQNEQVWLLGDSGYAQRPWLMTPILNAAPDSPEAHFTERHVQTRNVVERCFGVLKTRWRCLLAHRTLHYNPIKAGKIVNACVVLHNLINEPDILVDQQEMQLDRELQFQARTNQAPRNLGTERHNLVHQLWEMR